MSGMTAFELLELARRLEVVVVPDPAVAWNASYAARCPDGPSSPDMLRFREEFPRLARDVRALIDADPGFLFDQCEGTSWLTDTEVLALADGRYPEQAVEVPAPPVDD